MKNSIRVLDIIEETMADGPGLRTSIYCAGCLHHCPGCHNPQSWDMNGGREMSIDDIMEVIKADEFCNVSFSGGDPLHPANCQAITDLAQELRSRFPQKTIWLYTGFEWEEICTLEIVHYLDVLVDGRYIEKQRDTKLFWRGSANQRVIDVQKTLSTGMVFLHCN